MNYLLLWRGRHGESDREETSAESPGNSGAHMVLSWYGGSEWHMNESGSLFHCACLICPLSFLHQPIFSDIVAPPPSSRLAATYITLTNHRLRGQRRTLRRLSPSGFDVIGPVVCLNSPVLPFCVHKLPLHFPYPHTFRQPFSSPDYTIPPAPNHQSFAAIVLRSWAYWRVTLEWASFCACT